MCRKGVTNPFQSHNPDILLHINEYLWIIVVLTLGTKPHTVHWLRLVINRLSYHGWLCVDDKNRYDNLLINCQICEYILVQTEIFELIMLIYN